MKSSLMSGKSLGGCGLVLAVTLAILMLTAPHEAWPKVALFIFFRRHRQQPSHLHGRKQRPKLIHRQFLAAVAEDGREIRIPIDAVVPPILAIDVCSQVKADDGE
jgi:hypothetical protein